MKSNKQKRPTEDREPCVVCDMTHSHGLFCMSFFILVNLFRPLWHVTFHFGGSLLRVTFHFGMSLLTFLSAFARYDTCVSIFCRPLLHVTFHFGMSILHVTFILVDRF